MITPLRRRATAESLGTWLVAAVVGSGNPFVTLADRSLGARHTPATIVVYIAASLAVSRWCCCSSRPEKAST